MTATPEDASLATQCLDFCQMLAGKSLFFSFSLTVGNNFSFSVESMGKAALSSPTKKKKKPTPSTVRRNARRREEFLKRKLASAAEESRHEASEEEAKTPGKAPTALHHHPSPSPSMEKRKVITVGREKEVPTFSQLDGATPSAGPAARKEMTSRREFCSKLEWEIGRLVMRAMCCNSEVACPSCFVKVTEVGGCMACIRGFDRNNGKRYEGHPNLKCRSCQ